MNYNLPTSLEVCGVEYAIRHDYRALLDLCDALSSPELNDQEKAFAAFTILYPDFDEMPQEHYKEALQKCFWFLNCGQEENKKKSHKLVDWSQDIQYIVPPINRILGGDIREEGRSVHWWTFVGAYYEIGDCLFAQIVSIRDKLARGKKLEKHEREWYRQNKELVDFKTKYTQAEEEFLRQWI